MAFFFFEITDGLFETQANANHLDVNGHAYLSQKTQTYFTTKITFI
jgi:hypothetical protein